MVMFMNMFLVGAIDFSNGEWDYDVYGMGVGKHGPRLQKVSVRFLVYTFFYASYDRPVIEPASGNNLVARTPGCRGKVASIPSS